MSETVPSTIVPNDVLQEAIELLLDMPARAAMRTLIRLNQLAKSYPPPSSAAPSG